MLKNFSNAGTKNSERKKQRHHDTFRQAILYDVCVNSLVFDSEREFVLITFTAVARFFQCFSEFLTRRVERGQKFRLWPNAVQHHLLNRAHKYWHIHTPKVK